MVMARALGQGLHTPALLAVSGLVTGHADTKLSDAECTNMEFIFQITFQKYLIFSLFQKEK